jgi:erythritol transport system ATP-binding protein
MTAGAALVARDISKQYPGTLALDRVNFMMHRGAVNVLVGENGAGKSTLMRILAGIEEPDSGTLEFDGPPSVAMIHQELNLLPDLSVSDNIFLAREQTRWGLIDRRAQLSVTRELMARLEQPIDAETLVGDLPLGQQQVVEIAKALARDARILIMDEPTSALSAAEVGILFRLIRDLKSHGVSVVYISHRMEELLEIGDRVTVLRDGRVVAESKAAEASVVWIVEKMTGGTPDQGARGAAVERGAGTPVLAVESVRGVSFAVHAGQIAGLYGLLGSGRTELLETLIGLRECRVGSITLAGRRIERFDIATRIRAGIALVPDDRQAAGIVPTLSVRENMMLANLRADRAAAAGLVGDLNIRAAGLDVPITSLSGGNQQKVVLSRYLLTGPKVLLLDEPTRGVDVGARPEIYGIIRRLAGQGMAIVFASSELDEILSLATRVLVFSGGRIAADLDRAEATEHALVEASAPQGRNAA